MGYIKQSALFQVNVFYEFVVLQLNTTLFIKSSLIGVKCMLCDLDCGVRSRILPVAQGLSIKTSAV